MAETDDDLDYVASLIHAHENAETTTAAQKVTLEQLTQQAAAYLLSVTTRHLRDHQPARNKDGTYHGPDVVQWDFSSDSPEVTVRWKKNSDVNVEAKDRQALARAIKLEEEAKRIRVDGEEDQPEKLDPRSYPAKPVWQRMIIISAGVVVNVITGVIFAAIAFGYGVNYNPSVIGAVTAGGPAWHAGIEPGGQVVSVGRLTDDNMHFRDMRLAILTEGLDSPDKPIDISIKYDDGVRQYKLVTSPHPDEPDVRMIGITSPTSMKLGDENFAMPGTVAADVLGPSDASGTIVSFDGTPINDSSIVPGTPFFDYYYTNPTKTIRLGIRRDDGTEHEVELPPQPAKSVGLRFEVGPIVSLVVGGPAEKAGIKVDDKIIAINGDTEIDAYSVPLTLVGAESDVTFTIRRGKGESAEELDLVLTPDASPQTLEPSAGLSGQVAVNAFGFCYKPLPKVARVLPGIQTNLKAGDEIKKVKLVWKEEDIPEALQDEAYEKPLEKLMEGWEFSSSASLSSLRNSIQFLPKGTELSVTAIRSTKEIVAKVVVGDDDRVLFDRGLGLTASEATQTAESFGEAISLGVREGQRRFFEVLRFLGMAVRGRVKLRHVGGPVEIVNIAKQETEKGISPQLMFLTMLSMNLAILNFLPIPALDGGHMMFLSYELIRGKRANEQLEFRLTVAGLLTLLMLMAVVFANDILRHL